MGGLPLRVTMSAPYNSMVSSVSTLSGSQRAGLGQGVGHATRPPPEGQGSPGEGEEIGGGTQVRGWGQAAEVALRFAGG